MHCGKSPESGLGGLAGGWQEEELLSQALPGKGGFGEHGVRHLSGPTMKSQKVSEGL